MVKKKIKDKIKILDLNILFLDKAMNKIVTNTNFKLLALSPVNNIDVKNKKNIKKI